MPIYRYKHLEAPCAIGERFEVEQPMRDEALETCPECDGAVRRVITRVNIATPTGDSSLKSMGFTKLVKRDDGVYENVTRTGSESRYMEADKPETMPDLKRKIGD
jgi:putative FmdB family regulatory protein